MMEYDDRKIKVYREPDGILVRYRPRIAHPELLDLNTSDDNYKQGKSVSSIVNKLREEENKK